MEFDADGNFIRRFGDGLFDLPHSLVFDAQDNIRATEVFLADTLNWRVQKYVRE